MNSRTRKTVYEKTNGFCAYCGCELDPFSFHIEHIQPRARGGSSRLDNLVPSCKRCNRSKRTKTAFEFRLWIINRHIYALDKVLDCLRFAWDFVDDKDLIYEIDDRLAEVSDLCKKLDPKFFLDDSNDDFRQARLTVRRWAAASPSDRIGGRREKRIGGYKEKRNG